MRNTLLLAIPALLLNGAAALAEARATTAPTVGAPETFGDWTLRCGDSPSGSGRACEVDLWITPPGQKAPIAQIAFGRQIKTPEAPKTSAPGKKDDAAKAAKPPAAADAKPEASGAKLIVLIPVNVTIAPGIEFITAPAQPRLTLPLKTCIQAACFAELELTNEQIQAFRNRSQPGQMIYIDPAGQPVTVDVSFKGLDQALDSLEKR